MDSDVVDQKMGALRCGAENAEMLRCHGICCYRSWSDGAQGWLRTWSQMLVRLLSVFGQVVGQQVGRLDVDELAGWRSLGRDLRVGQELGRFFPTGVRCFSDVCEHDGDAEMLVGHGRDAPLMWAVAPQMWVSVVEVHSRTVTVPGRSLSCRFPLSRRWRVCCSCRSFGSLKTTTCPKNVSMIMFRL